MLKISCQLNIIKILSRQFYYNKIVNILCKFQNYGWLYSFLNYIKKTTFFRKRVSFVHNVIPLLLLINKYKNIEIYFDPAPLHNNPISTSNSLGT